MQVPTLVKLPYEQTHMDNEISCPAPTALIDLKRVVKNLVVEEDPWVQRLRQSSEEGDSYRLNKVLMSGKT